MSNTDLAPSQGGGAGSPTAPTSPFSRLVNELGVMRLGMIAAVTGAVIVGVVYLSNVLTKPPMGLLFANLDFNDAAAITEQLDQENVVYELRGNGSAVFVDQSKVLELRMRFAGEGLPAGQDVGYELFDEQNALGQTSFQQNLNRQRALEGELARTIRSISKIETARVHLVLPERELFAREEKQPTASIVVKTRGFLDRGAVQSIQHLVASAVPGLSPGQISIIDERGNLLASGGQSDEETLAGASLEDRQAAYEERLRQRVLDIVNKYTGTGRAQVQVSADLDFNRVTEQSTIFDPDAQVVATTVTIEESENDQDREANDQAVTIAGNLPGGQASQQGEGASSSSSRNRTEEEVTYQNSQTVRTEVREAGRVQRLSVAVLVDGFYETSDTGERTYAAREQSELDQIAELVRSGIGFDEARGDQLTVANLPFAQADVPLADGTEGGGSFLSLGKADYIYLAQLAALALVGLVVLLFIIRPLLLGLMRTAQGGAVAGGQLAAAGTSGDGPQAAGQLPAPGGQTAVLPGMDKAEVAALLQPKSELSSHIDIAQIEGQVKESSIKKIGEVVANHPDESAAIVRSWLQQDA